MSGALPDYLDLTKAGHTPLLLAGALSLSRMPRLCAAVTDAAGQVKVDLRIFKEGELAVVRGKAQADLGLSCQRCFGTFRYQVNADVCLAWTGSRPQAAHLPSSYEMLDSSSGRIRLAELIEDELLLALPLAARHATTDDCVAPPTSATPTGKATPPATGRRPFEILKTLRRH